MYSQSELDNRRDQIRRNLEVLRPNDNLSLFFIKPGSINRIGMEEELRNGISSRGMQLVDEGRFAFTQNCVHDFYPHGRVKFPFSFHRIAEILASEESLPYLIVRSESEDIYPSTRKLVKELRKKYAVRHSGRPRLAVNAMHGSESRVDAHGREIPLVIALSGININSWFLKITSNTSF